VVSLKNGRETQRAIARFSEEINLAGGETFRLVTSMDSASVTIDSRNVQRFESFVSESMVNRRLENLAEIVLDMPVEIETSTGILSAIVSELSMNDVVIRQFTTVGPGRIIILVNEADATWAYASLASLSSGV
jgi:hypothetical protein